jgi:translation initiation factor 2B subunit (eIF-2B alpha/beta/delta family)
MDPNTHQILLKGIEQLQNNFKDGASILATQALAVLSDIVRQIDPHGTASGETQWKHIRFCAYRLSLSRPSMSSPITSVMLAVLDTMDMLPAENRISCLEICTQSDREKAWNVMEDSIKARQTRVHSKNLGIDLKPEGKVVVLTLSNSSTIRRLLVDWVKTGNFNFEIRILESRPTCEGADLAAEILRAGLDHRGLVILGTDAHICELVKGCDIVLLGADRILPDGSVVNKMGSLAAAVIAKQLSDAKVLVYSETDKISEAGAELDPEDHDPTEVFEAWSEKTRHALKEHSDRLRVPNIYFELVPAQFVDGYVTEFGAWNLKDIHSHSSRKAALFNKFFDLEIRTWDPK